KDFYKKWNYEVQYVGHPLVEVVDEWQAQHPNTVKTNIIALLPGSRRQEILKKLPVMLEVSRYFTDHEFVVAMAPGLDKEFYNNMLSGYSNVKAVSGKTYDLLMQATAALVTSGTATLETALFAVPEVVCYKGSAVSYEIAKRVIKIKYISLVNLIMDKPVVKELIQHDLTVNNVKKELREVLGNQQRIQQLQEDYSALKTLLSQGGHASTNAAKAISNFLQSG
ncbi:MAG TPA: lipid-A-disaccharide synthase, partial [Niabella sp.]|nr:lipid-A-disaccharide synthase [Niabella sp.]